MNAVMAYDCVYWLKDAIERAGSAEPEKIRDALESTKGLKLLHCTLTMGPTHDPEGKDGVMLRCDPKERKSLFFAKIRPE